jgi:hypothetical protein
MYDSFDLPLEETRIILIDRATISRAQRHVIGCEACNPEAEIPFDLVLDQLTGNSGALVDYVLERPATCLRCGGEINEKTLVEWDFADL